jgi:hypothetical protein
MVTPPVAAAMRKLHPLRLSYEAFGDANPFLAWLRPTAERVRRDRRPVAPDNPLLALQQQMSDQIVGGLDAWRTTCEWLSEATFLAVYGNPVLQAAVGVDPHAARPRRAARSLAQQALVESRIAELRAEMTSGGVRAALIRALIYVGMARGTASELGFAAIRRRYEQTGATAPLPIEAFKALVRTQFFLIVLDEAAALAAIPQMLPADAAERRTAFAALTEIVEATGPLTAGPAERLAEIARLFDLDAGPLRLVPGAVRPARKAS